MLLNLAPLTSEPCTVVKHTCP